MEDSFLGTGMVWNNRHFDARGAKRLFCQPAARGEGDSIEAWTFPLREAEAETACPRLEPPAPADVDLGFMLFQSPSTSQTSHESKLDSYQLQ